MSVCKCELYQVASGPVTIGFRERMLVSDGTTTVRLPPKCDWQVT
jgi:hypothetical protein